VPSLHLPRRRRGLLALGAATALVGGAAAYRKVSARRSGDAAPRSLTPLDQVPENDPRMLGWGSLETPPPLRVTTVDGCTLAVWDVGSGPTVVLPHCWGCSHAVWIPVARRLIGSGHRVVLYDQRGHGASSRGSAPLSIEVLGDDLALVLEDREVTDAVLAGHSMGGMTIMSLAAYRPEVLDEKARALVLVATAAADMGTGPQVAERFAAGLISSPAVTLALRSAAGHRFVRGAFGDDPVRSHVDLTGTLFAGTVPHVRSGFLRAMSVMNLLEGIASIHIPTTVMVGSRDRITAPARAAQLVAAIPGARLVTLPGRGHMLPLEDPDAVVAEIEAAFGAGEGP
jgi:non-heme chloroperoxidase